MSESTIQAGAVRLEGKGETLKLTSTQHRGLSVIIPLRLLELWALRKMREEALQPEKKA